MSPHRAPSTKPNGRHAINSRKTTEGSTWGDTLSQEKNNNNLRIIFQNINGLGYDHGTSRGEELRQFIEQTQTDVMLIAEVNVNWRLVSKKYSIHDMSRGWFENQSISIAYNQHHRCRSKHLPGGVGVICRGETALRKIETKNDSSNLGRWTWTKLQGKDGIKLRIVSVYVPCRSTEYGNKKVYCQQQKALQKQGEVDNPIRIFWRDFWITIDAWLEAGDKLIIGGDWNQDVRDDTFLEKFKDRNLVPAITSVHGSAGPETFNRGSKPIDELFVSSSIQVASAGYLSHGDGLGDHRPIWIEVTKNSSLGAKLPPIAKFSGRRLKMKDPRIVNRYLRLFEDACNKHHLFARTTSLFQSITPFEPLTKAQEEEYEKLDALRVKAMKNAERKCRKLYMGNVRWSPQYQLARDRIKYIRNCISKKKGTKIHARTLIRDAKRAKIDIEHFSLSQMEQSLSTAFEEYKKIKQQHIQLRQSYLEDLAQAMEENGKGNKSTHLRNLITLEEQRAIYRKLRITTKKNENLSTTFVTVKDENGNDKDIIEKREIEDAIMEENCKKYHQTEDTCPFIKNSTLLQQFGLFGEGPASKLVFDGTYTPPPTTDPYTTAYLSTCQHPNIPQATFDRTCSDYKKSWEIIDERISSRELHFGHFKAACKNGQLIRLHYQMAEIPFRTGYGPNRWKGATQVMILKKAGLNRIDKLRTIVLYEADFNHNNKWFGRQLMRHTKKFKLMSKEQYSVPGKKSIDHALNRRLIFDIIRYKKTSLAMTSCDLKSCYDRIAHTPATLAIVGYRYLPTPIFSMFNCIQNMRWTTRTVYGDSEKTFGGSDPGYKFKPQGMGQGNGAGPSVWSTVSSRMFEVLHKNNHSTRFHSPLSKGSKIDICGFAFVDDSDIIAGLNNSNDPETTVNKMQRVIDCWEGVAKTTGGALEPSKSWWYLIHFQWNDGKWKYGNLSNVLNDTLTARDKNNNRVELQYLPSDKAQTMLGVELAPDGNNDLQFQTLLQKAKDNAELIRTSGHLLHSEAWIALTTMAIKSIEYGLPASTFTEKQLTSIMTPLLQVYLPRSGIQRNIKRDLLYGPISLQGFGLHNPYLTQGIAQITDIIDHQWKNTITGKLIHQSLEHLRIEIGCNFPILSTSIDRFELLILTDSWITNLWRFMSKMEISWQDNTPVIPLRRENDVLLMEHILTNDRLTATEIKKANQCRIYLQVMSLADITTGNGRNICSWATIGKRNLSQARTEYEWPLWGTPSKSDWRAWRKSIRHTFCTRRNFHLDTSLGNWTIQVPSQWQWFVNCFSDNLFHKDSTGSWTTYKLLGRRTRQNRFRTTPSLGEHLPPLGTMAPTTIQEYSTYYQAQGTSAVSPISQLQPLVQDNYLKWLQYTATESTTSTDQLITDIIQGKAIAVSDGSFDPITKTGAAAWIITSKHSSQWIRGTSISPGSTTIQNPYRSEILGILAILHQINQLCRIHQITNGSIIMACDGISALRQATRRDIDKISCRNKQSDLLSACTKILLSIPITIQPQHVKGHQDDTTTYNELTFIEQKNVDMDVLAKATVQQYLQDDTTNFNNDAQHHPYSFQPPKLQQQIITENVKNQLYEKIGAHNLHEYWISQGRYNGPQIESISWTPLSRAMHSSNATRRRFISKWVSENVATGANMKRWRKRPHDYCPFCKNPKETTSHIIHCNHSDAILNWEKHLLKYLESLYQLGFSISLLLPLKEELTL